MRWALLAVTLAGTAEAVSTPSSEEYAVIRTVLAHDLSRTRANGTVVLLDSAGTWANPGAMATTSFGTAVTSTDAAIAEAIASFRQAAHSPVRLDADLLRETRPPVTLISKEALRKLFAAGRWDEFYRRYPGSPGYSSVSRVGFDHTGRVAVIYLCNQWDGLAGSGEVIALRKEGEVWVERARWRIWVS